jgi:hypothetical protein
MQSHEQGDQTDTADDMAHESCVHLLEGWLPAGGFAIMEGYEMGV